MMNKEREFHDLAHEVKDESSAMYNTKADSQDYVNEEQHNKSNEQFNKLREEMLTKGHDIINNRVGKH